jgi:hypothetical protein
MVNQSKFLHLLANRLFIPAEVIRNLRYRPADAEFKCEIFDIGLRPRFVRFESMVANVSPWPT